jgi:hypothetical protein
MQDRQVGPLRISVWSNPDVGTGSFYILVDPPAGGTVSDGLHVQVAVQPVSGRLPEKTYDAWRDPLRNRVEFKALVPFDKQEQWRVRVILAGTQANGEISTTVPVTPTLLGRASLLFFMLPFLLIAFIWMKALRTARKRKRKMLEKKVAAGGSP